jgi:hypothetical protein
MTTTYEKIATTTGSGTINVIEFTSIPQTYTDLVLIFKGDTQGGVAFLRFNGDSGANYATNILWHADNYTTQAQYSIAYTFAIPTDSGGPSNPVQQTINIQSYTNTNTFKSIISRANATNKSISSASLIWRSTAAITSVSLYAGGTYGAYAATLYGIKAE